MSNVKRVKNNNLSRERLDGMEVMEYKLLLQLPQLTSIRVINMYDMILDSTRTLQFPKMEHSKCSVLKLIVILDNPNKIFVTQVRLSSLSNIDLQKQWANSNDIALLHISFQYDKTSSTQTVVIILMGVSAVKIHSYALQHSAWTEYVGWLHRFGLFWCNAPPAYSIFVPNTYRTAYEKVPKVIGMDQVVLVKLLLLLFLWFIIFPLCLSLAFPISLTEDQKGFVSFTIMSSLLSNATRCGFSNCSYRSWQGEDSDPSYYTVKTQGYFYILGLRCTQSSWYKLHVMGSPFQFMPFITTFNYKLYYRDY